MRKASACSASIDGLLSGGDTAPCGKNDCDVCGADRAAEWAAAIGWSMVVARNALSFVIEPPTGFDAAGRSTGEIGAVLIPRMNQVIEALHAKYLGDFATFWLLELSQDDLPNIHLLQTGTSSVKQRALRGFCREAQLWLPPEAREDPTYRSKMGYYVMKVPLAAFKIGRAPLAAEVLRFSLDLNGGEFFHASEGFFRDEDGRPIPAAFAREIARPHVPEVLRWLEGYPLAAKMPGRLMERFPEWAWSALGEPPDTMGVG